MTHLGTFRQGTLWYYKGDTVTLVTGLFRPCPLEVIDVKHGVSSGHVDRAA